jgi:hypothetical protein
VWAPAIVEGLDVVEQGKRADRSASERPSQGVRDDLGVGRLRDRPPEDGAAVEVEDDGEVEPALPGRDAGDVADNVCARCGGRINVPEEGGRGTRRMSLAKRSTEPAGSWPEGKRHSPPVTGVGARVTVSVDGGQLLDEPRFRAFAHARLPRGSATYESRCERRPWRDTVRKWSIGFVWC